MQQCKALRELRWRSSMRASLKVEVNRSAANALAAKARIGCPSVGGQRTTEQARRGSSRRSRCVARAKCAAVVVGGGGSGRVKLETLQMHYSLSLVRAVRPLAAGAPAVQRMSVRGVALVRLVKQSHGPSVKEYRGLSLERWSASLALRSTAEPGRKVGEASALRLMPGEGVTLRVEGKAAVARSGCLLGRGRGQRSNPSIERTANGGRRSGAPGRPYAPLSAAHVER